MKLLGFKIKRDGSDHAKPLEHTVWAGFTTEEVAAHKQFILTHVWLQEVDGAVSFEDVESEVVILSPGMYRTDDGALVEICKIKERDCFGYTGRISKKGKWKRMKLMWFWVNGEAHSPNTRKIVEKIK